MLNSETSFAGACKDFFGLHPNQTLLEFRDEVKALTDADRAEIKAGLEKIGYRFKVE